MAKIVLEALPEIGPCVICGTRKGWVDQIKGTFWRDDRGQCRACHRRGGKPREVAPCVECGDPGGSKENRNGCIYVIRIRGLCKTCYLRGYKRRKRRLGITAIPLPNPRISPSREAESDSMPLSEHAKRIRSKQWVQEYRRATWRWSDPPKAMCKGKKATARRSKP